MIVKKRIKIDRLKKSFFLNYLELRFALTINLIYIFYYHIYILF